MDRTRKLNALYGHEKRRTGHHAALLDGSPYKHQKCAGFAVGETIVGLPAHRPARNPRACPVSQVDIRDCDCTNHCLSLFQP